MNNYEKKYKEMLESARYWHSNSDGDIPNVLEDIFPELRENEDKSIIKEIISIVKSYRENCITEGNHRFDNCISWLEKRLENPVWTDNDRAMTFTLLRDIDQITYITEEGKNERFQWLNSLEDRFNKEK